MSTVVILKIVSTLKSGDTIKKNSALYFQEKMIAFQDSLEQVKFFATAHDRETRHKVKEKQKQVEQLTHKNKSLQQYLTVLWQGITLLVVVALLLFWIYRKTRFKNRNLEKEKDDTLKEVRSLRQSVIKKHLILKDKTKVYVNELLCVKSEDHYIRVFTANGKSRLVRGRLSDLENQLPPNFIRTHRSYIINRKYVKFIGSNFLKLTKNSEIPVSSGFKDNLDKTWF